MPYNRESEYKIISLDLSDDTQVNASGGTDVIEIKPNIGFIYQIINIEYEALDPDGGGASTTGSHNILFNVQDQNYWIIKVIATFGNNVAIYGSGFGGDGGETPSIATEQYKAIHEWLVASNSCPLTATYTNSTDKNQTGTRTFHVLVKKYREAI